MRKLFELVFAIGTSAVLCGSCPAQAAETDVDVALVLAVDVSRSMDADELQMQREGYIAAFRHPEVIEAIRSGFTGRIAATYVEWAGPGSQEVVVPWTLIDGAASADAFARQIRPGMETGRYGTSISSSLMFTGRLFANSGYTALRRVIDMSGDGANNNGPPVGPAREAVLAMGITINGLPIMLHPNDDPFGAMDIDAYYRDCVIGGSGAFTLPVRAVGEFEVAIRRKIIQEVAAAQPRIMPAAAARVASARPASCGPGEPPIRAAPPAAVPP